jgi:hypothetical protein
MKEKVAVNDSEDVLLFRRVWKSDNASLVANTVWQMKFWRGSDKMPAWLRVLDKVWKG